MLLRALRGDRTGEPSPLARLLAGLLVLGLLGVSAPVLLPLLRWLAGVLG